MFKRKNGSVSKARRKSGGEVPVARRADLGSLSQCMMDADSDTLARARRLRSRALVVSIALQVLVVAALLIGPLLAAPGALPLTYVMTPVPPYRGGGNPERPQPRHVQSQPTRSPLTRQLIFSTASPARRVRSIEESAPDTGPWIDIPGAPAGPGPIGPAIIGGTNGLPAPPPRPAPTKPLVHRSEGVMQGQLVRQVQPRYPEIARTIHLSGTVRLEAIIGIDGTVRSLNLLNGNPILARAAVDAVRQWRYRPTLLNGAPVEVETYITVNFVLSQ